MRWAGALAVFVFALASPSSARDSEPTSPPSPTCWSGDSFPAPSAEGSTVESYRFEVREEHWSGAGASRVVRVDRRGDVLQIVIEEWRMGGERAPSIETPRSCALTPLAWKRTLERLEELGFWTQPLERDQAQPAPTVVKLEARDTTRVGSPPIVSAIEGAARPWCDEGVDVRVSGSRDGVRRTREFGCVSGRERGTGYARLADEVIAEAKRLAQPGGQRSRTPSLR